MFSSYFQRLLNLKNWLNFIIVTAVFWDLRLPFPRYYRVPHYRVILYAYSNIDTCTPGVGLSVLIKIILHDFIYSNTWTFSFESDGPVVTFLVLYSICHKLIREKTKRKYWVPCDVEIQCVSKKPDRYVNVTYLQFTTFTNYFWHRQTLFSSPLTTIKSF